VNDRRVARRYAKALFQAARSHDIIKAVESDLELIVHLIRNEGDFRHFLLAPYVSRDERTRILDRVFTDRVTALTTQVIRVMMEKRREAEIENVYEEFVALRREHERVVYALITSAEPLGDAQRAQIVAKLHSLLGRTVEPDYKVDAALIGGVRVTYENNVLDGSVQGALTRLREKLRRDLLKQN
jgi:F-type H+-transporting ATPase subunit delta